MEQTDIEKTEAVLKQQKEKMQRIVQKLGLYVMKQRAQHKQEPDQITQHIFLGSYSAACNKESLHGHNIKHVLMCLGHLPEPHVGEFNYKQIRIKDSEDQEIRQHFDSTYEFIENAVVKEQRILVHCFAGVSRSTTILAAYLMRKSGESLDKVLELIQKKRSIVRPNSGFMDQLRQFEKSLFSQTDQNEMPQPTESAEQAAQVDEQPAQTAEPGEQQPEASKVPESEPEKLPAVEPVPEVQKVEEARPEAMQTEAYKDEASRPVEQAQPVAQESTTEPEKVAATEQIPQEHKQQEPKPEEPTSTEAPKEAQKPVQEAPSEAQKSVAQTTETTEPDAQQGEPTEKEPQQESKTEGKKKKNKKKKK